MYKTYFKNLAEKENGNFYFKDDNLVFGDGVRSPNVTYIVKFDHGDNHFTVINRTGTAYVATISCKLSKSIQPIEFEINNISHFNNLFLRRKKLLEINTKNQNIKYFLTHNDNFESLERIAGNNKFSPIITCIKDKEWSIIAKYHLEFDNWTEPIEPIIKLFKDLIAEFEQRIANISPKAYREMN